MPERIQRKRTRGWRMPENAVYVGRPAKWGNPFPVGAVMSCGLTTIDAASAVGFFEDMTADPELMEWYGYPTDYSELRGKDLACWCPLDQPCHADVLLQLANDDQNGEGGEC